MTKNGFHGEPLVQAEKRVHEENSLRRRGGEIRFSPSGLKLVRLTCKYEEEV